MKISFIGLMLIIAMALFAENIERETDFRNVNWGMSRSEVKKTEKPSNLNEYGGTFFYTGEIFNLKTIIIYVFNKENKLNKGTYLIKQPHQNENEYISDYFDILKELKKKYGKPVNENIFWSKKIYKDDPEKHGIAVSLGHLSYQSFWDLKGTIILLKLNGKNHNFTLSITYIAKKQILKMHLKTGKKYESINNDQSLYLSYTKWNCQ